MSVGPMTEPLLIFFLILWGFSRKAPHRGQAIPGTSRAWTGLGQPCIRLQFKHRGGPSQSLARQGRGPAGFQIFHETRLMFRNGQCANAPQAKERVDAETEDLQT